MTIRNDSFHLSCPHCIECSALEDVNMWPDPDFPTDLSKVHFVATCADCGYKITSLQEAMTPIEI